MKITLPHVITWVCLILLMLIIGYVAFNNAPTRKEASLYEQQIKRYQDSLQKHYEVTIKKAQADSLHQEQLISKYTDSTTSLKKQLDENDNQTTQAKVIYRDKIKYINTLSDDNLALYFTALVNGQQR